MALYVRQMSTSAPEAEIEHVALIAVAAFDPDPVSLPLCGGDKALQLEDWRANIRAGLIDGVVYVAGFGDSQNATTIAGFAVWYGPGQYMLKSPESKKDSGFNAAMEKHTKENLEWREKVMEGKSNELINMVMSEERRLEAWHLLMLATAPTFHRRGIARGLIDSMLTQVDEEHREARVETCTDLDISIYERFGFEQKAKIDLPSPHGDFVMTQLVRPRKTWKRGVS